MTNRAMSLTVRNSGLEREITSLVIRVPKDQMAHSFLQTGQVDLELDEALFTAWRQPKNGGENVQKRRSVCAHSRPPNSDA